MESNREIPPMKNNSYVRTIAEQAYGDCMEHIDEYPTYEDLSGNGDYINLANNLIEKITQTKPGFFGRRPYQLISIERRPEIYLTCGVLAEGRDFIKAPIGAGGDKSALEDPSPTKLDPSDFDPWDYSGRLVDAQKLLSGDSGEIKRVANERGNFFVPPKAIWTEGFCDDCNGTGKVECTCDKGKILCPTCKGEVYYCPSCNGLGSRTCGGCGGRGWSDETSTDWGWKTVNDVDYENGSYVYGKVTTTQRCTCTVCGGSGQEECDECHGLGILECPECNGEGHITCPECNGTKKANCKTCHGHGEKIWALFMLQKFFDYFEVAPVTGFRTGAPYDLSLENGTNIPGGPLSFGIKFTEDTEVGFKEGTKEPESFMGVNLKPYFDEVRKQVPEDDKWRYDSYYARAYMRDCVFIKYTLHGYEREFCYFPAYNSVICDLRHPKYHGLTSF